MQSREVSEITQRTPMLNLSHHTLDNGLTVLLREVHSAPVISW